MEKNWYVEQYLIGWGITLRQGHSKLRYPITHGPFSSEEEAATWAISNLEKIEQNESIRPEPDGI